MISDFGDEFLPRRQTEHSAGYDFYITEDIVCRRGIFRRRIYTIDTGIHLQDGDLKHCAVMLLFPRSSIGFKYGMRFMNTTGVIDSDYRDSIKCSFTVDKKMVLHKGDRFMQGVIVSFDKIPREIVPTRKRNGGIGSTDGLINLS